MEYTDAELKELEIERTTAPGRGRAESAAYIYKCTRCGNKTMRRVVIITRPVYCSLCKNDAQRKKNNCAKAIQQDGKDLEALMGLDPKSEDRFYKAAKTVRKLGDYETAIKKASIAAHKYGSVPEAIAAIMLISCGIKIIPQAKIFGDNRSAVDFILPDHKAVIEIDGALFHSNIEKRIMRDEIINYRLGDEWKIIHVSAEDITKRPRAFKRSITRQIKEHTK